MTEKSGVILGGGVSKVAESRTSDRHAVRIAAVRPIHAAPRLMWRHCSQWCESAGGSDTTAGAVDGLLPKNSILSLVLLLTSTRVHAIYFTLFTHTQYNYGNH